MGNCNLDHSLEDVQKKFETQRALLPSNIHENFMDLLGENPSQEKLNKVFHLLKKYDLASDEERAVRNAEMEHLLLCKAEKGS
jgi:hypothetical protein